MQNRKSLPSFMSFALGALAALTIAGPAAIQFTSHDAGVEHTEEALETTADPCAEATPAPDPTATSHTSTATVPTPSPTSATCEDDTEGAEETETETEDEADTAGDGDNHGKVVSTAAHCPIKGRAHGELVRSIAHDKEATVADAEAACEAALAALEAGTTTLTKGKPDKEHKGGPKWAREDDSDDESETDDLDDEASVDSVDAGDDSTKAGGPPSWAGHGKDK